MLPGADSHPLDLKMLVGSGTVCEEHVSQAKDANNRGGHAQGHRTGRLQHAPSLSGAAGALSGRIAAAVAHPGAGRDFGSTDHAFQQVR
jgi:hypothetical protein